MRLATRRGHCPTSCCYCVQQGFEPYTPKASGSKRAQYAIVGAVAALLLLYVMLPSAEEGSVDKHLRGMTKLSAVPERLEFLVVTDLDKRSFLSTSKKPRWKALLRKVRLTATRRDLRVASHCTARTRLRALVVAKEYTLCACVCATRRHVRPRCWRFTAYPPNHFWQLKHALLFLCIFRPAASVCLAAAGGHRVPWCSTKTRKSSLLSGHWSQM